MMHRKILCLMLSIILFIGLFSGCGKMQIPSQDTDGTAAADSNSKIDKISLEGIDKTTAEYPIKWLQNQIPGLTQPEQVTNLHSTGYCWELYGDSLYVTVEPQNTEEASLSLTDAFSSFTLCFNQDLTPEQQQTAKTLALDTAVHFLGQNLADCLAPILDIGPIPDASYVYPGDPHLLTEFFTESGKNICCISLRPYHYMIDTSFSVRINADTGYIESVHYWPQHLYASAELQQYQEKINQDLMQAGHPLELTAYDGWAMFRYTGTGEDTYTPYLHLKEIVLDDFGPCMIIETLTGAGEEVKEALRTIVSSAVQQYKASIPEDYMDAFFDLRELADMDDLNLNYYNISNEYGASISIESTDPLICWINGKPIRSLSNMKKMRTSGVI